MNRRHFLSSLGSSLGMLAATQRAAAKPNSGSPPNVVLIITDDQRFDTIGALGNPVIHTPNIDKLVHRGFTFRNAYCMGGATGAVCIPSRNMLLTGRAYFDWSNRGERFASEKEATFPKSMKNGGYETFHYGKGSGRLGNNAPRIHAQFDHYNFVDLVTAQATGDGAKQCVDGAIDFLGVRNTDRPFFLYLALPAPHDPRCALPKWRKHYHPDDIPLPPDYLPMHPFDNGDMLVRDEKLEAWPRTPLAVKRHLLDYYAVITGIDENVGRLMDAVKQQGLDEDTIFIFTSDQGLALGSHGLMGKQNIYESGMKVPLVLAGPGIPQGESGALVYLLDIFPTVCELTGLPNPQGIYGKSSASVLQGRQDKIRDTLCLSYKTCQRSIRDSQWKLIVYPEVNRQMFFAVDKDPYETTDLATDSAHAPRIAAMKKRLKKWQNEVGDAAPLESASPKSAEWSPPDQTPEDIMNIDNAGGPPRKDVKHRFSRVP